MKKRRRAYKKYDWKAHKAKRVEMIIEKNMVEIMGKVLDEMIMYGKIISKVDVLPVSVQKELMEAVRE